MLGPVSTGMGDRVRVQLMVRDIYLDMSPATPGQLSLANPLWVDAMNTSQRELTPCS